MYLSYIIFLKNLFTLTYLGLTHAFIFIYLVTYFAVVPSLLKMLQHYRKIQPAPRGILKFILT